MTTILITGACGGIGSALARHWDTPDKHLLLLDHDSLALQALDDELNGDHTLVPFDLWRSGPDVYHTLAQMISEDHPELNAVVHLAGYNPNLRQIVLSDPEIWLKTLQINLTATLWLTQQLLPLLRQSHGHLIFTPFDTHGAQSAYWHGFGVAQDGLKRLMNDLVNENATYPEVALASIQPGWVDTALTRAIFPNGQPHWALPEEITSLYDQALAAPAGQLTEIRP